MNKGLHSAKELRSLKDFYQIMGDTALFRRRIVECLDSGEKFNHDDLNELKKTLGILESKATDFNIELDFINEKKINFDVFYEISELKKDLLFLEQGEEKLFEYLNQNLTGFNYYFNQGINFLQGLNFNCLISDRDGTTNNYCGRYRSSIQSIYNAFFLTEFAKNRTQHSAFITSAPLRNPGIVDVSVNKSGYFIYAASKGREVVNVNGFYTSYPIPPDKQHRLDQLLLKIEQIVNSQDYEKFSLIGSGLQKKFGQITIARQDIANSVSDKESKAFLSLIQKTVEEEDSKQEFFRIEDTGLDIEIILTIESQDKQGQLKDFDKGDGVLFLNSELELEMSRGRLLVCGDTASDVPMLEAAMNLNPETRAVFVTTQNELKERVERLCPHSLIVPEPDILVSLLFRLSRL